MANVEQAVQFVLKQEDSRLEGVITNRKSDRGGVTRFGLTERWHPELSEKGFFTDMPTDEALQVAIETYKDEYAKCLCLEEIKSQPIATALLSFAVVEGVTEAVGLLQRAAMAACASLERDGKMGEATLKAVNEADPAKLLAYWVTLEKAFFAHLAEVHPGQNTNLRGWDNRAEALLGLITPEDKTRVVAATPPAPTKTLELQPEAA